MVEDLGVEAKEAAVREVAKLLPLPELLQSIASIKADYIARQQVLQSSISVPDQPSFSATFIQLNSIPTFFKSHFRDLVRPCRFEDSYAWVFVQLFCSQGIYECSSSSSKSLGEKSFYFI